MLYLRKRTERKLYTIIESKYPRIIDKGEDLYPSYGSEYIFSTVKSSSPSRYICSSFGLVNFRRLHHELEIYSDNAVEGLPQKLLG